MSVWPKRRGMEWDKQKEWMDGLHLRVNLDRRRHQKYRVQKTRAARGMIKRLTRLPPREKAKLVVGLLLPMLLYVAELHDTSWEEGARLVRQMSRWVVGAYRGSSGESSQRDRPTRKTNGWQESTMGSVSKRKTLASIKDNSQKNPDGTSGRTRSSMDEGRNRVYNGGHGKRRLWVGRIFRWK